jgi:hypothetical protein
MRTLTQVWVFLLTLIFLFLLISFQLLGRSGLLFSFFLSVLFFYAALRNNLKFFKGLTNPQLFSGNDPSGFLSEIENHRLKFGFKKVDVHITAQKTPPLVWKNNEDHGHILLNRELIYQLNKDEIRLLALFLLSHLENRSFVIVHILSTIRVPLMLLSYVSKAISAITHKFFKTSLDCFSADLKFMTVAETTKFESGYFLNRLHRLSLNKAKKPHHYCFFSTLSIDDDSILNEFGIPDLNLRLKRIMGFSL